MRNFIFVGDKWIDREIDRQINLFQRFSNYWKLLIFLYPSEWNDSGSVCLFTLIIKGLCIDLKVLLFYKNFFGNLNTENKWHKDQ